MQGNSRNFKKRGLALGVAAAGLAASLHTQALEFEFDDSDLRIDWDTNVTYGVMWRVQSADSRLSESGYANVNDGSNNFDTGIVSNKVSVVSEADFNWGDYGFFVRGKALYDYRYENQDTDMSQENYFSDNSGDGNGEWTSDIFGIPVGGSVGDVAREDFHEDTKDIHGKDAFFLDAFLYGNFFVADRLLQLRLGRQVVSWGESAFYQGVSGTQSYTDAAAATAPGTEIKEIFMPLGQLYGNLELNDAWSLEAFYQYEWKFTKQAGVGSYWSNADTTGAGAERFLIIQEGTPIGDLAVPFDVLPEDEPEGTSEESSWGIALRYFLENGTEFGFYRTTYHDKFLSVRSITNEDPALPQLAAFPEAIQDYYQQDVDLYAVSMSTLVGDVQVSGEISYHDGALPTQQTQPTLDPETGTYFTPDFQTGYRTQANLGFSYLIGSNTLSDGIVLAGEAAYVRTNLSPGELLREQNIKMINTKKAWGYTLTGTLNYKSVLPGLDLDVPMSFKHSPEGIWKDLTMQDGAKAASIGLRFKYLGDWKGNLKYTTFWGAKETFRQHDRDNISFDITYTF